MAGFGEPPYLLCQKPNRRWNGSPYSQEVWLREAGVQRDDVYRDIGVSGATGTDQRHDWYRLDGRLSGGDTFVGGPHLPDRLAWLDTLECIMTLWAVGEDQVDGRNRRVDTVSGAGARRSPRFPAPDGQHGGVGGGGGAGGGTPAHQGGAGGKSTGQPGTSPVPQRAPSADDQAHEGHRRVGQEDRGDPGGQRKDGVERPEGGTVNGVPWPWPR